MNRTVLISAALAMHVAGCSSDNPPGGPAPGAGDPAATMAETYCDSAATTDALELCLSFSSLFDGSNTADVGGFDLELVGGAEIVGGRVGAAVRFDGTDGEILVSDFTFDGDALTVEAWV